MIIKSIDHENGQLTVELPKAINVQVDGKNRKEKVVVLSEPTMVHVKPFFAMKQMAMRSANELAERANRMDGEFKKAIEEKREEAKYGEKKSFHETIESDLQEIQSVAELFETALMTSDNEDAAKFLDHFISMLGAGTPIGSIAGQKFSASKCQELSPNAAIKLAVFYFAFFGMESDGSEQSRTESEQQSGSAQQVKVV